VNGGAKAQIAAAHADQEPHDLRGLAIGQADDGLQFFVENALTRQAA